MSTETKKPATVIEQLGNLPAIRSTFYQKDKPELAVAPDQRVSFLRFKTDKESNTLRKSVAVIVNKHTPSAIIHGSDKGTEFLQALIDAAQDEAAKQVAEGKADFEVVQDYAKLIADYFDNSRAGGSRVSAEIVGKFFDSDVSSWLMDRVIAKFPQFDADKVAKVVTQYRASFCDLTKYQMPHTKPVIEMLAKAWNEFLPTVEDQTDLHEWISARIKKQQDRHNGEQMMLEAI